MKIKSDFVTNSSSSAFVVIFPKRIRTIRDVEKYIPHKYAKTVFHDALSQKPKLGRQKNVLPWLLDQVSLGEVIGYEDDGFFTHDKKFCEREGIDLDKTYDNRVWRDIIYDEYRLNRVAKDSKIALEFLEKIPGDHYVYKFTYADDSGEYFREMEHGNIFHKLQHLRISHH